MPQHTGSVAGRPLRDVPATVLTDPDWLREDVRLAARMYGRADDRVLGTVRWYSASSVLVAPALESLVLAGTALHPGLERTTFHLHPDGRFGGASATGVLGADLTELGAALAGTIEPVVRAIAALTGAATPALWAIAADSIGNRLLWAGGAAGDPELGTRFAAPLASAIGHRIPSPRYLEVGGSRVLRRSSCCLIYEATGGEKCTSCPRQRPAERARRLHELLG
ncbi:(2Fe-2S)-binding protein [Amycolatopsis cihanbeyliensis]|uniref:FhuF-like iron-sulfur protein n=1 Tax=Amycolatopsis cihanbeyliensis TaxID=1128664 RepID=A0A542DGY1_AMYCI|nr:(2Fe-2S)-binding protein [Amycolatopsis cihanbeyliensis]TQJ02326.1 FhuF-like iron-sulfur protein [Amycolatopsis cihanbeyliensis]